MAMNLVDLLSWEFLSGDTLRQIAGVLGEPKSRVATAVNGAAPAVVAALASKAGTSDGLSYLVDMMRKGTFDGNQAGGLAGLLDGGSMTDLVNRGAPLVASLFGERQGGVTDWLSSMAGIAPKSASMLLGLAVPTVLSLLGGQAKVGGGLTPSWLGSILGDQAASLKSHAPKGLASALGITDFGTLDAVSRAVPTSSHRSAAVGGVSWWPWAALAAAALLGLWWLGNRQPAGTIDPRITVVNDEGRVVCSARVRDAATRDAILTALRGAFGAATTCDVVVDANVKPLSALPNVDKILEALKQPGTEFTLD